MYLVFVYFYDLPVRRDGFKLMRNPLDFYSINFSGINLEDAVFIKI